MRELDTFIILWKWRIFNEEFYVAIFISSCKSTSSKFLSSVLFIQLTDTGSIHVVNIDRNCLSMNREIDLSTHGHVVDLNHFDAVTQNVIAYCTVNGNILGKTDRV